MAAHDYATPCSVATRRLQPGVGRRLLRRPREPEVARRRPAQTRPAPERLARTRGRVCTTALRVSSFQTLQDPLAPIVPPYHRVPQLNLQRVALQRPRGGFDRRCPRSTCASPIRRSSRARALRSAPTVVAARCSPRVVPRPKLRLRYATYSLTRTCARRRTRRRCSVPLASLDSGLVFERDIELLRPGRAADARAAAVLRLRRRTATRTRSRSSTPRSPTSTIAQLFTENRFVGGDRFGDAEPGDAALSPRACCEPRRRGAPARGARPALLLRGRARRADADLAADRPRVRRPGVARRASSADAGPSTARRRLRPAAAASARATARP